jgi:hypothetical protein
LDFIAVEGLADLAGEVVDGDAELAGFGFEAELDFVATGVKGVVDVEEGGVFGELGFDLGSVPVSWMSMGSPPRMISARKVISSAPTMGPMSSRHSLEMATVLTSRVRSSGPKVSMMTPPMWVPVLLRMPRPLDMVVPVEETMCLMTELPLASEYLRWMSRAMS